MEDHIIFDSSKPVLDLLDQRLLPTQEKRFLCQTTADAIYAIQTMVVRGAPAIGVAAAFACALAVHECSGEKDWRRALQQKLQGLAGCRPTAVNLAWAVNRQLKSWKEAGGIGPDALLSSSHAKRRKCRLPTLPPAKP